MALALGSSFAAAARAAAPSWRRALHPGTCSRVVVSSLVAAKCSSGWKHADAAGFATGAARADEAVPLAFVAESFIVGEAEKGKMGIKSQDAVFITKYAVGVADGVSGWLDEGVDAGEYSRAIMRAMEEHCRDCLASGDPPNLTAALEYAYTKVRLRGSTTVCAVAARPDGSVLARNLGDSAVGVWRYERARSLIPQAQMTVEEAAKLWAVVHKTAEQTHGFNTPKQLGADKASDSPRDAQNLPLPVRAGDFLILATDGLWDNIYPQQVSAILAKLNLAPCHAYARMARVRYLEALQVERKLAAAAGDAAAAAVPLETRKILGIAPEVVTDAQLAAQEKECRSMLASAASLIVTAAQKAGNDPKLHSPFAAAAAKAGFRFQGGKADDVAVVVALAVADETSFTNYDSLNLVAAPKAPTGA